MPSVFVILKKSQESVVASDYIAIIPMNGSHFYEGANKSDCKLYYYILILIVSKKALIQVTLYSKHCQMYLILSGKKQI